VRKRTWLAGYLLLLAGCFNENCDDEVCDIHLVMDIHPDGNAWSDGAYRLTWLGDDGKTKQCQFNVPFGFGDCDVSFFARPTDPAGERTRCSGSPKVGAKGETGSCTPGISHFVMTVWLPNTPGKIALQLQRDDGALFERTFQPSYQTYYPNGRECGPTCQMGRIDFSI
jgi:hypothetical protein